MRIVLRCAVAGVWVWFGLCCKILGVVDHQAIVAEILGETVASFLTPMLGVAELGMAAWVLSGRFPRLNAALQIALVMTMNIIEQLRAPDLLLFGRMNFLVALGFSVFLSWWGFVVEGKPQAES